jgi:uncharacterized protein
MELLYNPDLMSEEDVKATFVARQSLIERLTRLIQEQPKGAGVQHAVIIAPRGMGKTTVLRMVQFAVNEGNLSKQWQVVRFPEERYNINDLADFWIEILQHIADDSGGNTLQTEINQLTSEFKQADEIQEVAYAHLKDWTRKNKKRLVVLVDNFDQILEQIGDERENARLRDILMNDGTLMIIGGATTFFQEARAYEQPLYNFFKIYNLNDFSYEEIIELLLKRAGRDGRSDLEAVLKNNQSRLHALRYFTGGNPRLVLMLYDVIAKSSLTDVRNALEKLLDEVTPYFKAKIETLPAQQRKIVDYIARLSGETNEGLTPTDIASAVRMSPNQVSSQLKRLTERGYVRPANLRGRSSYYSLSEPLFSIWHQMRSSRNSKERRRWLVSILRAIYDSSEFGEERDRLDARFLSYVRDGQLREAKDTLEHKLCLIEAVKTPRSYREVESIISCWFDLGDFDSLKSEITTDILRQLSHETLKKLLSAKLIDEKQFGDAETHPSLSKNEKLRAESSAEFMLGRLALSKKEIDEERVLSHFKKCTDLDPTHHNGLINHTTSLCRLGRLEEAIPIINKALETQKKCYNSWMIKGDISRDLKRMEEAIEAYSKAIAIDPAIHDAWCHRNDVLFDLGLFKEALKGNKKLIEINSDDDCAWANQGAALIALGKLEKAIESIKEAIRLQPDRAEYRVGLASALNKLGKYDEAIHQLDEVLRLDESLEAWFHIGHAYASKTLDLLITKNVSDAELTWKNAVDAWRKSDKENWLELATSFLMILMKEGELDITRRLIASSSLEKLLFPLLRAIKVIQTEDNSLIEKLAPEVKGMVEKIVLDVRSSQSREQKQSGLLQENGIKTRKDRRKKMLQNN